MTKCEILLTLGIGVFSSLIGGYALAVFGVLEKWIPFLKFKNTGVIKVFKNQERATKSILIDIGKSKKLYVLAMKGDSFSNSEKPLSTFLSNAGTEQRYLISTIENPYLQKRGDELDMNMITSLERSIVNFNKAKITNNNIRIGRHNEVVRFRIILLSNYLYLSFQEEKIPGRESTILKIENNSPMYNSFSSLFDDLWEKYVV